MVYVRGQARDYDGWAQLGNRGWSWDDVLPYFIKSEHREGAGQEQAWRGRGGPLHVADQYARAEVLDTVLQACQQRGYPLKPGLQ